MANSGSEDIRSRLAAIVESSDDAILSSDSRGFVLSWNQAAERLYGYPAEEIIGQHVSIMAPEDRKAEVADMISRLLSGERISHFETRRLRKDGQAIDVALTISPIRDADGRVVAFSTIARDLTERKQQERALRASEQSYRKILETANEGVWLVDKKDRTTFVNGRLSEMLGYPLEEMSGKSPSDFYVDEASRAERREHMDRSRMGIKETREVFYRRKDGSRLCALVASTPLLDEGGAYNGTLAMVTDITERVKAEQSLRESERLFRSIFNDSRAGQILSDAKRNIVAVNRAFSEMTGFTEAELIEGGWSVFTPEEDWPKIAEAFERVWQGELTSAQMERRYRCKDGRLVWGQVSVARVTGDEGELRYVIDQVQDVTDRRRAQEALEHQALHDSLTGLPNRVLLRDRLEQAILVARRSRSQIALLIMDLDHFKEVNDTYGHPAGDQLLRQVGERFRAELRDTDTIARLGGDEFAILLLGTGVESAPEVAGKLLASLERPFVVAGQALDIGASIGIAVFPEHADSANAMLRRADIAMYVAKRSRHTFAIYSDDQEETGDSRLALMAQLRQAINDNDLFLHYQPIASLQTGRIERVEALVRWQDARRGPVPPAEFIGIAEQTGLIQLLTHTVLTGALRQCSRWRDEAQDLGVAVNISMRNLLDPRLPDSISELLNQCEACGPWLTLEITESAIMAEPERTLDTLHRLRALGVRLSIDDFGTGYSSLAYLHKLPVHELKIDRSFVHGMKTDSTSLAIVKAAVDLGHNLKLAVVAEGIEDRETWEQARSLGVDFGQGYYLSRPVAAEAVLPFLMKRSKAA